MLRRLKNKWILLSLLWLMVALLAAGHVTWLLATHRLMPNTDMLALLPKSEQDPVLQKSFDHIVASAQDKLMVLIGHADWEKAKLAATQFEQQFLENNTALKKDKLTSPAQEQALDFFYSHRGVLLTPQQRAYLQNQPQSYWVNTAQQKAYGLIAGPKLGSFESDPFDLYAQWVMARLSETPIRPKDGMLWVEHHNISYVVLTYALQDSAFALSAQESIAHRLTEATNQIRHHYPDVELWRAGVVLHAAAASQQAQTEMNIIGWGSMLGIACLLMVVFRSLRPVFLISLSLVVGVLGALSVSYFIFAQVHIITLVFGASLIGVAEDYGIYYLCHRLGVSNSINSRSLIRQLLPGLFLTLITTLVGYLGLIVTPFPGLQQMAVFSALGLLFAWVTVVIGYPILMPHANEKSTLRAQKVAHYFEFEKWFQLGRYRSIVALLMLGFIVWGCTQLKANDDIRNLQSPQQDLVIEQNQINQILQTPSATQYFLIRSPHIQDLLMQEEALTQGLQKMVADKKITAYQSISTWLPSLHMQESHSRLIEKSLYANPTHTPNGTDGAAATDLCVSLEEDKTCAIKFREQHLKTSQPMTLEALLASPSATFIQHLWLGKIKHEYASVVVVQGLHKEFENAYQNLAREVSLGEKASVEWVNKVEQVSHVLKQYRIYMTWVIFAAYLVIALTLWPRYGLSSWRVLAPTAMASLLCVAIFGSLGVQLQLLHVLALLLLLGLGVDHGIFLHEANNQNASSKSYASLSIGLSAMSTILSFGLLGFSSNPALQAFGLTMLIGTSLVWLCVPFFFSSHHTKHTRA